MSKEFNPFNPLYGTKYFCGRQKELSRLTANIENGYNTLVHSERRIGKTTMILRLFEILEEKGEYETIYVDLFSTSSMNDFIKHFTERILSKYHKNNLLSGIKRLLFGINASFSLTSDGSPLLSLNILDTQIDSTLGQIFDFLEKRKKKIVVAFDEFQEISNYSEKAEAIIRTYVQYSKNIRFIFSGSTNHILRNMFFSASKPFYQSSDVLVLHKIDYDTYFKYIKDTFGEFRKEIDDDAIDFILDFTDRHSYYTQFLCNITFYKSKRKIKKDAVKLNADEILENRRDDFMGILRLLSANQRKIVIAVAKENLVLRPTSGDFIKKHGLPAVSSTALAVKTLVEKEVLYANDDGYKVYDVFFKRFLQKYF